MATKRGIEAGQAFILLKIKDATQKALQSIEKRLSNFSQRVGRIGASMFAFGSSLAVPLAASVKIAADAQEVLARFRSVFGEQEAAAAEFAEGLATSLGRSANEIKDGLANFQSLFVGFGFATAESLELSKAMESLALDFAAFNNLSDAEAQNRFISALSGSSEVVDRFGINLKQAALDTKLLELGIEGGVQKATEMQKAFARLAIIEETMGRQGALGTAEKEADKFNSVMKRLRAGVLKIATAIGTILIPSLEKIGAFIVPILERTVELIKANKAWVIWIAKVAAYTVGAGSAFIAFGVALKVIAIGVIPILAGAFKFLLAVMATIGPAVAIISATLVALGALFPEVARVAFGEFGRIGQFIQEVWAGVLEKFNNGDMEGAFRLIVTGIQGIWTTGINSLTKIWLEFKFQVQEVWHGMLVWMATQWTKFQKGLASGITEFQLKFSPSVRRQVERRMKLFGESREQSENAFRKAGTDEQAIRFDKPLKELEDSTGKKLTEMRKQLHKDLMLLEQSSKNARKEVTNAIKAPPKPRAAVPGLDKGALARIGDALNIGMGGTGGKKGPVLPEALMKGTAAASRKALEQNTLRDTRDRQKIELLQRLNREFKALAGPMAEWAFAARERVIFDDDFNIVGVRAP